MDRAGYLAFFDVDGTLLNTRSLLSFVEYYRRTHRLDEQAWFADYLVQLRGLMTAKAPRTRLNAFYYTVFRGQREEELDRLGEEWFSAASRGTDFFNAPMVEELKSHRERGAGVVLVTGSFPSVIEPLSRMLSCDGVLCTRLETADGIHTGALVGEPCIGEAKAHAVKAFAARRGVPLSRCVAYGDDDTDADMLAVVGTGRRIESAPAYREELASWMRHA